MIEYNSIVTRINKHQPLFVSMPKLLFPVCRFVKKQGLKWFTYSMPTEPRYFPLFYSNTAKWSKFEFFNTKWTVLKINNNIQYETFMLFWGLLIFYKFAIYTTSLFQSGVITHFNNSTMGNDCYEIGILKYENNMYFKCSFSGFFL